MTENIINQFKNGIFALNTRRFGSVAEIMIKRLFGFEKSGTKEYDLYDSQKKLRVEVKFSRVWSSSKEKICENNVIDQCLDAARLADRSVSYNEVVAHKFDCNIQQIKRHRFDVLYYGLFYSDRIEIFKVKSEKIDRNFNYSDHQHDGNKNEGQFHVNNVTLDFHRRKYLKKILTYEELYRLFQN